MKKLVRDNKGVTLVEILVAIAIMGIATVPLFTTFINGAEINQDANRVHNASILAQSIMEDFKAKDLSTIQTEYADFFVTADSKYVFTKDSDVTSSFTNMYTASNGRVYEVEVTLDEEPYSQSVGTVTDISDINSLELPRLPQLDKTKSVVISDQFNFYDKTRDAVTGYLPIEIRWIMEHGDDGATSLSSNLRKKITLTFDDSASAVPTATGMVLVSCDITYTSVRTGDVGKEVVVNVYQGLFSFDNTASDSPSDATILPKLEAYLFWNPSLINSGNDTIEIVNKTNNRIDVYVYKEEGSTGGALAEIATTGDGTRTVFDKNDAHKYGKYLAGNIYFRSNMGTASSVAYDSVAEVRCYELRVVIRETNGEEVTEVISTKEVFK